MDTAPRTNIPRQPPFERWHDACWLKISMTIAREANDREPSRLASRLAAAAGFAAALVATAAGCLLDEPRSCDSGGLYCENGHLLDCREDSTGRLYVGSDTNCAWQGQICVSGLGAACVDDVPCAESTCEGSQLLRCASGHLFSKTSCLSPSEPGLNCVVAPGGKAACVHTEAPCPPSGADSFCDSDGHTGWDGCGEGYGYATSKTDCAASSGNVCAVARGMVSCVLPGLIACTEGYFCSPGHDAVYHCGEYGLVDRSMPCTGGQTCRDEGPLTECALDIPCDFAKESSICSPDGRQLYICDGHWIVGAEDCPAGSSCVEAVYTAVTYASCKTL